MRSRSLLLSALFVVSAACGAGSDQPAAFPDSPYGAFDAEGGLHVELRTAPSQPPERGVVAAQLHVTDASGAPQDGLAIDVVPWMIAHGHGSSVTPLVVPTGDGNYRIDRLQLAMPGTWQLRFDIKAPSLESHASTNVDVQ